MKDWRWIAVVVGGLCAVSCRANVNKEVFQRELRLQEDEIFALCDELEDTYSKLDAMERDNARLRQRQSSQEARPSAPPPASAPRRSIEAELPGDVRQAPDVEVPGLTLPRYEGVPGGVEAPPFGGPPEVRPPDPNVPEGVRPAEAAPQAPLQTVPNTAPAAIPNPGTSSELPPPDEPAIEETSAAPSPLKLTPASAQPMPETVEPTATPDAQAYVTELVIDPEQSGLLPSPDGSFNDGVVLRVQARDAEGNELTPDAEISMVVVDATKTGSAARVARWDFSADEAAQHVTAGGGWQFELRWPNGNAPPSESLQLFVRLAMANGTKLISEIQLQPLASVHATSYTQPVTRGTANTARATRAAAATSTADAGQPAAQPTATGPRTAAAGAARQQTRARLVGDTRGRFPPPAVMSRNASRGSAMPAPPKQVPPDPNGWRQGWSRSKAGAMAPAAAPADQPVPPWQRPNWEPYR